MIGYLGLHGDPIAIGQTGCGDVGAIAVDGSCVAFPPGRKRGCIDPNAHLIPVLIARDEPHRCNLVTKIGEDAANDHFNMDDCIDKLPVWRDEIRDRAGIFSRNL